MIKLKNGTLLGGIQEAATAISTPERPVSRQRVYSYWKHRESNGFPEKVMCRDRAYFPIDKVKKWYEGYVPGHGGRPAKDTSDINDGEV